ncbi:hypothetical protein [Streptomyces sp. CNQ085]|uniref:hypothetical protein n=1 Tax=Streptomyces sp. CNQ085 TaxID=2886944 RepID=UPI001F50AABA|nr:hypothetical protein [Streptomyces sp. CNQ085]MCI0385910.1 hypothetical protein [Streptomyces sp. CNQ085]
MILDHLVRVAVGTVEAERPAVPAEADDGPAAGRGTRVHCGVGETVHEQRVAEVSPR